MMVPAHETSSSSGVAFCVRSWRGGHSDVAMGLADTHLCCRLQTRLAYMAKWGDMAATCAEIIIR